ncbi:hypothetical protein LV716_15990 [Flagellimonas sp. HMM57]|uniref:ATP-grasp domain-containing protein n=1 Tax=unclassified Flagellimonas TaxID=2644544 RepID=UPI0013D74B01|nr:MULTISPECIES: hypothetical protein [unclassified Flagellimonas]UII75742.1 hypothetical protein LV716_15990 [Flagellimonas sp. HMM57]
MYDIVILTDRRYIDPKEKNEYTDNILLEDRLVAEAFENIGLKVIRKSWDDPKFDWTSTKYALFRTTWDYFDRFEAFSKWLDTVSTQTRLINCKKLIDWNIDKHYLKDLAAAGITIPKTVFVEKGMETSLAKTCEEAKEKYHFKSNSFVLKPCVSGAARHTYKFDVSEITQHETIFKELIATEAMMLQEFQHNIVEQGEISMMVFNGKFTHAVLKVAKQGDFRVQDDFGGSVHDYKPSKTEIEFSEKVVNAVPELPIYARVDIFKDNNSDWALAELEIFEPELWFRHNPEAAIVLALTIKERYFS